MTTPLRVAFSGPPGSGKTTHARMLQKHSGGDVLSFANPLKKVTRELFGEAMDDETFARTANQEVGVAVRNVDRQTWVRLLLGKVSPDRPCYVDDCRFYNEYVALKQLGFTFVRLGASLEALAERRPGMTAAQRLHESELEAASIPGDFMFLTDSPVEDVHEAIVYALSKAGLVPEKRRKLPA